MNSEIMLSVDLGRNCAHGAWPINLNGHLVSPYRRSCQDYLIEDETIERRERYYTVPEGTIVAHWRRNGRDDQDIFWLSACENGGMFTLADDPSDFNPDFEVPTVDFSERQVLTLLKMDSAIQETMHELGLEVTGSWIDLVKKALGVQRRPVLL